MTFEDDISRIVMSFVQYVLIVIVVICRLCNVKEQSLSDAIESSEIFCPLQSNSMLQIHSMIFDN